MKTSIADEILEQARQVPIECQERVLDVLKGMVFTKKCIAKSSQESKPKVHK